MEQECRETSLKELPTRELKIKRHKDRRDCPTVPPIRLRLKSSTSPSHSETEVERSFSDRSVSSSPDNITNTLSPLLQYSIHGKINSSIDSFPSSPNVVSEVNHNAVCEAPLASQMHAVEIGPLDCDDSSYDQPLDMSTKRIPDASGSEIHSSYNQQHRPSVITCASALLKAQCHLSDVAHHTCLALGDDRNNSDMIEKLNGIDSHSDNFNTVSGFEERRLGHRREIVSGSCDPVIDEHFRRSLGKDYQQIFSKSASNSVSITVDDHFAKALGETWLQLKQSKPIGSDVSSPSQSPNALQSQQTAQFIQHSPEIVST